MYQDISASQNPLVSIVAERNQSMIKTLSIQKPAYGGYGLCFDDGKAIFVPYAYPGETVKARIVNDKKDYSFAKIEEVLEKSPDRIAPDCENFERCGGCNYLSVNYETELRLKNEILTDTLARTAGLRDETLTINIIYNKRLHYRSHATIKAMKGRSGFFARSSNTLVPFPDKGCTLLAGPLQNSIKQFRPERKEYRAAMDCKGSVHIYEGKPLIINEHENDIFYERDINLFFQANRFLRTEMLSLVREYATLNSNATFLDIGCGVGFFSIYLAQYALSGTGIDRDRESIKWARTNAKRNGISNIDFKCLTAHEIHPQHHKSGLLIVDPPRAGLEKRARKTITAMKPDTIIYISCNPTTFARDLKDFLKANYSIKHLTLIDMFPGTYHIEIIAHITRDGF